MVLDHCYHGVGFVGGGRGLKSAAVKRLVSALRGAARRAAYGVRRLARYGGAPFPRSRPAGLHNISLSFAIFVCFN